MNIDWQIVADTGFLVRTGDQVGKFMHAAPVLIERLNHRYGGTVPEKVTVILMHGPVEIKAALRNGKLSRRETMGTCILEDGQAWVLLSINNSIGKAAIHEFMHMLGFADEQFVGQAVKDFVNLEKLEAGATPAERGERRVR